jgi:hypothetical protein
LRRNGWNREAITDGDLDIVVSRTALQQLLPGCLTKTTPPIRLQEKFILGTRLRANIEELPLLYESRAESAFQIEFRADGISCGCVGLAKIELSPGAIGGSGAPN